MSTHQSVCHPRPKIPNLLSQNSWLWNVTPETNTKNHTQVHATSPTWILTRANIYLARCAPQKIKLSPTRSTLSLSRKYHYVVLFKAINVHGRVSRWCYVLCAPPELMQKIGVRNWIDEMRMRDSDAYSSRVQRNEWRLADIWFYSIDTAAARIGICAKRNNINNPHCVFKATHANDIYKCAHLEQTKTRFTRTHALSKDTLTAL